MPSKRPGWKIYKEEMSELDNGEALWEPAPAVSSKPTQVGDVGYIRRGHFHLLFSAGCPLGERQLGVDVPLTFEPLNVGTIVYSQPRQPGHLSVNNVREIGADLRASVSPAPMLEPGVSISFQHTEKEGAALVTRHLTYRGDVQREAIFKAYTKRHYDSWVTFARDTGHGDDDIKLVLVTGVDMTRDFAMMAYSNNGSSLRSEFTISAPMAASASASVWGTWRTEGLVHTNCGPQLCCPPSSTQIADPTSSSSSDTETVPGEYNQCVFVRYFTMRKRALMFPTVIRAAAGPHDLGPGGYGDEESTGEVQSDSDSGSDRSDTASSLLDDDMDDDRTSVTSIDSESDIVVHNTTTDEKDDFDVIADYVFRNSDAESVLIHHRDIALLREPGSGANISTQLLEKQPPIVVDRNGVGTIRHLADPSSSTRAWAKFPLGIVSPTLLPVPGEIERQNRMASPERPSLRVPANTQEAFTDVDGSNDTWKNIIQWSREVAEEIDLHPGGGTDSQMIPVPSHNHPHELLPASCALRQGLTHSKRTDPLVIGALHSSVTILSDGLNVTEMSTAEFVSNLRSFMHSSSRIAAARNLRGEEAQRLIDFIDQTLTLPELGGDIRLRKQCLHLLYKVCNDCELLPTSYKFLGPRAATKHFKFGTKDTFDRVFKAPEREIIGWKRLSHPNLPLLGVSFSTDPQDFRFVSDWMENGNMMGCTRVNPEVNRLQSPSGAISGMKYLHELMVPHGDLRKVNILFDGNGAVHLTDFGSATISAGLNANPPAAITTPSPGTIRWTCPELFIIDQSDPPCESDYDALGMVIYEALTGLWQSHLFSSSRPCIITDDHLARVYHPHLDLHTTRTVVASDNPDSLGFSGFPIQAYAAHWIRPELDKLAESATRPPTTDLFLQSPHLPWKVRVRPRAPSVLVTVYDLPTTIQAVLEPGITPEEWAQFGRVGKRMSHNTIPSSQIVSQSHCTHQQLVENPI